MNSSRTCRIAALALGSALLAPLVRAQSSGSLIGGINPFHFGASGGLTVPVGDVKDGATVGWHLQGLVGYSQPVLPFRIRGEFIYHHFGRKERSAAFGDGQASVFTSRVRVLGGTVNGVVDIPVASALRPYLIAGVGVYNSLVEVSARSRDAFTSGHQALTRFGINGGGGVAFTVGGMSTFLEARFYNIFRGVGSGEGGRGIDVRFIPLSVGIMFR